MNLIYLIDYWRADDEFYRSNFYFIVVKEFWYGKKIEFFWRIYLNIVFWILLWTLTFLYFPGILLKVSLKWETKIDGRGHEMFSEKNSWAMKNLGLWPPELRIFFLKNLWNHLALPPTYLMYALLVRVLESVNKNLQK